jgi:hypothetical protein
MSYNKNNWLSPRPAALPDFIIGGAMKCGTTTLHHILAAHPDVYIPENEIHFFDMDNILQHGDFNFYDSSSGVWWTQNLEADAPKFWAWYAQQFKNDKGARVVGEDSTTYLASPIAAARIAAQPKPIKMVFMLR